MFGAPPPPGFAPSSFTSLTPSSAMRTKSSPQPSQPLKSFNWAKLGEVRQRGGVARGWRVAQPRGCLL